MWINKNKFIIDQSKNKSKSEISNLLYKNNLYVGTESGSIICYSNYKIYDSIYFKHKFDYLESCDINAKITAFDFMETGGITNLNIVSNERDVKIYEVRNDLSTLDNINNIKTDKYNHNLIREFNNIHGYMCNSISLNNDNQYFISSDYLTVNLWRPDKLEGCFTLIDIKPLKHTDLVYVINTSKFSEHLNTVFGYSTTNGEIILNDLRESTKSTKILTLSTNDLEIRDGAFKPISDFSFINENLIISRSLNNVTLTDIRNPSSNVYKITISETINENPSMLNSDAIYEKFKISENGKCAFTGTFGNKVYCIDLLTGKKEEIILDVKHRSVELNKTRHVAANKNGFFVSYGNNIYEYEEKF
ncbi:serine/threonine-protein phosphatase 2A 55 kDa regulatory subunit B (CDC55) [Vairimorpha necatrix]|uniref:Serine/threonine-protein phosphatase 2A 55 kDa regulatory subunit B (CDC55) n=1 Tax=Vairimorpha necatrix TaxID=6039 RepID=A0AAX4JC80_9MICR